VDKFFMFDYLEQMHISYFMLVYLEILKKRFN